MACDCTLPVCGNVTFGLAIKPGAPLSTACERAVTIGSIPDVLRYPNFTISNGAVATNLVSQGGIVNMESFMKSREGCYYDKNGQLSGSTCV